jgi:hypothetical protein
MQGSEINPPNGLHIASFLISVLYPVCGLYILREMSRPGDQRKAIKMIKGGELGLRKGDWRISSWGRQDHK